MDKKELIIKNDFDRKSLANLINSLDLSTPKKIVIEDSKTTRSIAQNRLLWLWNSEFQKFMYEHYGETASADEWHEILVEKLCPPVLRQISLPRGDKAIVGRSRTRKFTTNQMTEYLEKLDAYCAGIGLLLPHPSDLIYQAYGLRMSA